MKIARRLLSAHVLLSCVGVLAFLYMASPGRATFTGTNGKIVAAGTDGLYTFNPDGTGAHRILTSLTTPGPCYPCLSSSEGDPSWSADGTQIVFDEQVWFEVWPDSGIAIVNADGSGLRWLVEASFSATGPRQPQWSPDGTHVVFVQGDLSDMIAVVPASGGPITELVPGSEPDWAPDGSKIAFSVGGQIHVVNPDGSNETALTAGEDDADPSWSPDGTRLAFVRHQRLWTMSSDGSNQVQVLDIPGVRSPSWSPDGEKIAFSADGTYTLDLATSTVARVFDAVQPDWGTHPIGKTQTISFAPLTDRTFGDPDFDVSATASSGLAVSFTASGNCTVNGSAVHLTAAGSCTITASQFGDTVYDPAANVSWTFAIAKASQTITFGAPPGKAYGDPDFTVAAAASSGLPVLFAARGNCTLNGARVHLTGAGTCVITTSQPGNANYQAATSVSRSFLIRCRVPDVRGKKLKAAMAAIASRGCRIGTVRRAYSQRFRKGRVSSQSRRARSLALPHTKINLVVSRGRRH
jgi:dipeptidyl aminopeptidase/acylaminoacyl peptidase